MRRSVLILSTYVGSRTMVQLDFMRFIYRMDNISFDITPLLNFVAGVQFLKQQVINTALTL